MYNDVSHLTILALHTMTEKIHETHLVPITGGLIGLLVITIIVALLFAILIAVAILCKRKEPLPSSTANGWKARNLQSTLQVRKF